MRKIGYARVSTEEQNLDLQLIALEQAQCDEVFSDQGMSGTRMSRPGLAVALEKLTPGDTLIVWRLDRLGRSLTGLVKIIEELAQRGVKFVSLTEYIDTRTSGGMLMFHLMAALAQFERSIISERTRAGMIAAKARGKRLGRPRRIPIVNEDVLSSPSAGIGTTIRKGPVDTYSLQARDPISSVQFERHRRISSFRSQAPMRCLAEQCELGWKRESGATCTANWCHAAVWDTSEQVI